MDAHELAVIRAKCENDFYFFQRYFFHQLEGVKWVDNWHHRKIVDKLYDVFNYKTTRLVVNMPPRYSKTMTITVMFIAWCLMKNPYARFIHISYSTGLAQKNSSQVKNLINSDAFKQLWPKIKISKESRSKTEWYLDNNMGGLYATSSDSALTGFAAGTIYDGMNNLFGGAIIIDDPVKIQDATKGTPEQVNNYLDKINSNFNDTIVSRVNGGSYTPIIVVMQRVHQNDLAGFLLKGGAHEEFEHLCLPVQCKEYDALWPFKHSKEDINNKLKKRSSFTGQYQQDPQPDEKMQKLKIKWFKRYEKEPELADFEKIFLSLDTAASDKETNDPSVLMVGGTKENGDIYILDVLRDWLDYDDLKSAIQTMYNSYKPQLLLIENKSSGIQLCQQLSRNGGVNFEPMDVSKNKIIRLDNEIEVVKNGKVWLPKNAPWLYDLEQEFSHFPKVSHDDQVDAFSQLLKKIREAEEDWLFV